MRLTEKAAHVRLHRRSDFIAWVDPENPAHAASGWAPLAALTAATDELCHAVAPRVSGGIRWRMRPMVSRYGPGARFARHYDNHCLAEEGPDCNGRLFTAIYYLNEGWTAADGGCLRLFQPPLRAPSGVSPVADVGGGSMPESAAAARAASLEDVVADVAPVADRLLLFFSDFRCPHEVLETRSRARYAVTTWYMGDEEAQVSAKQA